jgi:2-dehydro-3-deoxygluconokinase
MSLLASVNYSEITHLNIQTSETQYDVIALGEVMLRLDPDEGRTRIARLFSAIEDGGEYNVARDLRRFFKLRSAIMTALADNEIGRLLEDFMLTGGLDISYVK